MKEAESCRIEESYGEFNNNSWKLSQSIFRNVQNNKAEDQQGTRRPEQHYKETRLNRHLQNAPPKIGRLHILVQYTWNVLQVRQYTRP